MGLLNTGNNLGYMQRGLGLFEYVKCKINLRHTFLFRFARYDFLIDWISSGARRGAVHPEILR